MFLSSTSKHPHKEHKPAHNTWSETQQERSVHTPTCFSGSSMNSSVLDTSTKCCSRYLCADLSRSLQECVSANARMPRQLEGSSWLSRNLQQASRTPLSCSRLAAGSNVWKEGRFGMKCTRRVFYLVGQSEKPIFSNLPEHYPPRP